MHKSKKCLYFPYIPKWGAGEDLRPPSADGARTSDFFLFFSFLFFLSFFFFFSTSLLFYYYLCFGAELIFLVSQSEFLLYVNTFIAHERGIVGIFYCQCVSELIFP